MKLEDAIKKGLEKAKLSLELNYAKRLCEECERHLDEDGSSPYYCTYGSSSCSTCGGCYCDQSC